MKRVIACGLFLDAASSSQARAQPGAFGDTEPSEAEQEQALEDLL